MLPPTFDTFDVRARLHVFDILRRQINRIVCHVDSGERDFLDRPGGADALAVNGAPGWSVKKITLAGIDVADESIDLSAKDVEDVEVVLTSKVSKVGGTASDDKGPVTSYAVVIFSSDPTKWIDCSRFVALGRPNQLGRFEVRGLPPEEDLALALTGVVETEWMSPEFLQQVRPLATPFVLSEGESKTVALQLKKRP